MVPKTSKARRKTPAKAPAKARPAKNPKATPDRPNILILWGDDVGWWNISYNSRGQMGYRTPNIDRVANEGVAFTDYFIDRISKVGYISGLGFHHLLVF